VPKRESFSVQIDGELLDRARNAVFSSPGLTMADLMEDALRKAVAALEKKNGGPFPKRKGNLKAGRPIR
jgi:hypothetical protein